MCILYYICICICSAGLAIRPSSPEPLPSRCLSAYWLWDLRISNLASPATPCWCEGCCSHRIGGPWQSTAWSTWAPNSEKIYAAYNKDTILIVTRRQKHQTPRNSMLRHTRRHTKVSGDIGYVRLELTKLQKFPTGRPERAKKLRRIPSDTYNKL